MLRPTRRYIWREPLFIVYRGVFAFILLQWCWGVLTYVWLHSRVNFIYLFDMNPNTTPWPQDTYVFIV
jgi:hypothetical protein